MKTQTEEPYTDKIKALPAVEAVQPLKPELHDPPWRAIESGPGLDGKTWFYRIESGSPLYGIIHIEQERDGRSPGTLTTLQCIVNEHNTASDLLAQQVELLAACELALRLSRDTDSASVVENRLRAAIARTEKGAS